MPKSKNRKAHATKVKARAQQQKHAQRTYEKWVDSILTPQAPVNPGQHGSFIPLTGSDHEQYLKEYFPDGHQI